MAQIAVVTGGRWHDFDFARGELLALIGEHDGVSCSLHADFSDSDAIIAADAVISYTCDVRPTAEEARALASMLAAGGRMLALHATNVAIDPPRRDGPRVCTTPNAMPEFAALLGSRFLAHPQIAPRLIEVADSDHPFVAGIGHFVTTDEIYVCEVLREIDVLLESEFSGACPGFEAGHVVEPTRLPLLFTHAEGRGAVTCFALGHCSTEPEDRRAWDSPQYREILRRTVAWSVLGDTWRAGRTEAKR